ncbi:hypothetical protein FD754_022363 [Muntiacus muntjak]|uniref:Spermatid nuclear transition protein 3-like n=1 Tax=Muntiacus muntjak TaxID=9888 RepID=A0A5N3V8G6_MUNMU|nr:hypothetical protein FD754_022363 [Muntiacus muntjak]
MTKVTRKPQQPRRVAMWFASRMKGRKKTLCHRRYRGSVKAQNMTMRVRRPLQGTLRKKIQSYATQRKRRKQESQIVFSSKKRYQNMRQSQSRRQKQNRR